MKKTEKLIESARKKAKTEEAPSSLEDTDLKVTL
jgi:hypothetical protein